LSICARRPFEPKVPLACSARTSSLGCQRRMRAAIARTIVGADDRTGRQLDVDVTTLLRDLNGDDPWEGGRSLHHAVINTQHFAVGPLAEMAPGPPNPLCPASGGVSFWSSTAIRQLP
jgi:hypothetical protein